MYYFLSNIPDNKLSSLKQHTSVISQPLWVKCLGVANWVLCLNSHAAALRALARSFLRLVVFQVLMVVDGIQFLNLWIPYQLASSRSAGVCLHGLQSLRDHMSRPPRSPSFIDSLQLIQNFNYIYAFFSPLPYNIGVTSTYVHAFLYSRGGDYKRVWVTWVILHLLITEHFLESFSTHSSQHPRAVLLRKSQV